MNCELIFIDAAKEGRTYPVGKLDDIKVYFIHYLSEEEAKTAWNIRRERMNYKNIFLLFSDRGSCTYDMLKEYDALPYKHKIVFCHKKYPEIRSAVYIPGLRIQSDGEVCPYFYFKNCFTYKRYYDAFDYVSWFNSGMEEL